MDFELDEAGLWTATAILPTWSAYLDGGVTRGKQVTGTAHGGSVALVFAPDGRDASPLTRREMTLVAWAIENERAVSEAVKGCLLQAYGDVLDPALANNSGRTIGLRTVYVHQAEKDDIPYIGFEFECPWNVEHGLGVLMHCTRCVEVGEADTAMLLWIAERDSKVN